MSYDRIFHNQFPFYLAIGMTYSEYWEEDCRLVYYYRQADMLRQQRVSNDAWLQGMYIYNAFGVVLSNAFSSKGKQPSKYLEEPIRVIPKTKEEKEAEAVAEREKIIAYLNSLKTNFDSKNKGNR